MGGGSGCREQGFQEEQLYPIPHRQVTRPPPPPHKIRKLFFGESKPEDNLTLRSQAQRRSGVRSPNLYT